MENRLFRKKLSKFENISDLPVHKRTIYISEVKWQKTTITEEIKCKPKQGNTLLLNLKRKHVINCCWWVRRRGGIGAGVITQRGDIGM